MTKISHETPNDSNILYKKVIFDLQELEPVIRECIYFFETKVVIHYSLQKPNDSLYPVIETEGYLLRCRLELAFEHPISETRPTTIFWNQNLKMNKKFLRDLHNSTVAKLYEVLVGNLTHFSVILVIIFFRIVSFGKYRLSPRIKPIDRCFCNT